MGFLGELGMTYSPLYIRKMTTGLVQSREEFILPEDAYPILENAFVWRERIKRRQGLTTLGRLRRLYTLQALGSTDGAGTFSGNLKVIFSLETTSQIEAGSVIVSDGVNTFTDNGAGQLVGVPNGVGSINYSTGAITIASNQLLAPLTISFNYFPGLPVMGLRGRELNAINVEQTVAFDTKYAYVFNSGWREFIPGTTWTGTDFNFFWTTNYWVDKDNNKIFWATNFSGKSGDPIRYTNGTIWVDFAPQINAAGDVLAQCLALLPFRGRLVAFNTIEGPNLANGVNYFQRVRWAAIGNPFSAVSAIVTTVNANAWRDDIRGQGGFLDIPTSENIVSVGFVRDNLVIYCERSTWQLRYTGRSIAPFQIEKVNSELGAESTFSAVQFDTSLVGIGDKGVVECDSYKSDRIDIKIPDLVFEFKNQNNGTERVYGIRDFQQRLAYWTYVFNPEDATTSVYPNRRLVYNYENDSWAIFTDSLTCFGNFQASIGRTWATSNFPWTQANFPWLDIPAQFPALIAGNQQGYVMYLSSNLQPKVSNDPTLFIANITGNTTTPTLLTIRNHNLVTGQVIKVTGIPTGTPFASTLNNVVFGVVVDPNDPLNSIELWKYNIQSGDFTTPQLNAPATYVGQGEVSVRDNFSIVSKKFNFLEQGQNIQMGYVDILLENTDSGSLSLNVYLDYNDNSPVNILPQNVDPTTQQPDTFFNNQINTFPAGGISSSKNFQRVFCAARGNFITLQYTLSNFQMTTVAQESDVQIDAQILWMRPAGNQLNNTL